MSIDHEYFHAPSAPEYIRDLKISDFTEFLTIFLMYCLSAAVDEEETNHC